VVVANVLGATATSVAASDDLMIAGVSLTSGQTGRTGADDHDVEMQGLTDQ
jgi:hypothetical protein